jgi:hypothetical protein
MQMVEAQDARGHRVLGNHSDIPVAGKTFHQIAGRQLPPIDLPGMESGHCRKRIQYQPLDPIEMRNFRPGGEAQGSARARLIGREAFISGAGAADMLLGKEAIGCGPPPALGLGAAARP